MKKLLQINTTLNCGSTGRIAEQIALTAQNMGWKCYIAHGGRYIGNSQFESIQISSKVDNYIHALYGELLGMHGLGSKCATNQFIKKIIQIKPDVIHLHNLHGYYLNYELLFDYFASTNIPIVWTLHDCWSFTGHCTHFENIGCNKWQMECGHCPLLMAQYKSRFIDRSRNNFLLKKKLYRKLQNVTIVPVSCWLNKLVRESILNHFPIITIHNGVDLDVFKPNCSNIRKRLGIDSKKRILLGVIGSGLDEKGEEEFIELSRIKSHQVVLIGLSAKEQNRLPSNILCLKRTKDQVELAELYSAADIFINPTYNDTFPTVNLEALACGTPVITYRTGGSPETIDEKTGVVVEKGNIQGLINAVDVVLNNGKEFYSKKCRERAELYFDKDSRFKDYIMLYENLMKNK